MQKSIIINDKEFKQTLVSEKYYVSKDGEIYSEFSKKILTKSLSIQKGKKYYRVDINTPQGKKHFTVHRLVFESWVRPLRKGEQVNHKDDNGLNNTIENLYTGNQKDNINDCFINEHRVGNAFYLTIYDKKVQIILTFCPAQKFIEYCGHPSKNGNISRFFKRNWFKKRYTLITFKRINNLKDYKSVTTMTDECKSVE